jgi:hypothetical protein
MNKDVRIKHVDEENRRVQFNTDKLEAALCIALSAAISLGIIGWALY